MTTQGEDAHEEHRVGGEVTGANARRGKDGDEAEARTANGNGAGESIVYFFDF